ncbi:MAG: NAD(P)/FAD-dependent oxidoreductase [Methermicoccaceae archaeon]
MNVPESRYDVVVVGAGPAGSIAAKTAASMGAHTLLIEKRQMIGDPVRCAEGVAKATIEKHIKPDKRWICAEVEGVHIYSPSGIKIGMAGKFESGEIGCVLDRKLFDRALANEAAHAGADVFVKTRATGLIMEDGYVKGIHIEHMGTPYDVKCDVVIGADGVESKIGRWAGIDTKLALNDIESCAQFLVYDSSINQEFSEFYLGSSISPGGYVWVFPKGDGCANVGIGVIGSKSDGGTPLTLLRRFIEDKFPNAKVLELIMGAVPVSKPMHGIVGNGIMLVGDAARQSDALTGGGIGNAMDAGAIAGEVAANAIHKKDVSKKSLYEYEKRWFDYSGKRLQRDWLVKEHIISLPDDDLDGLAKTIADVKFNKLHLYELLKYLIKKNPKFLLKFKEFL